MTTVPQAPTESGTATKTTEWERRKAAIAAFDRFQEVLHPEHVGEDGAAGGATAEEVVWLADILVKFSLTVLTQVVLEGVSKASRRSP